MAHVLMAATPFGGHQPPVLGVAAELVRRGHRVTYYTGAKYGHRAEAVGATWLPWRQAPDFDDVHVADVFGDVEHPNPLRAMFASFGDVFFGTGPAQLRDLEAFHDADPVDVVVGELTSVGAPFLHDSRGVPWVGMSLSPLALRSPHLPPGGMRLEPGGGPVGRARDRALGALTDVTVARHLRTLLNRARTAAGLAPTRALGLDALVSPQLHLCQGAGELEPHRPDQPATLHFVGDAAAGTRAASAEPDWLRALDPDRPIVHVTAGTLDVTGDLAAVAVPALAHTPAQVVVSGDPSLVPDADNVIAPGWVPHDLLLPRTAVVVSNGGYGGLLSALAYGVPVVVAPGGQDKPECAHRVARAGAGIDLRRPRPRPTVLRRAVEACLGDSPYRRGAHRAADALAAAGGAPRCADLVEDLLDRSR